MDFGLIREEDIDAINYHLPDDPQGNIAVLGGSRGQTKIYMGCPRWGTKEWRDKIYPKALKESNFLEEYVKHYNCIELNATHYHFYVKDTIEKWADKAKGRDFKFCPKVIKLISHDSNFINTEKLTEDFVEQVKAFGKYLGPAFMQLSEYYSPKKADQLFRYLEQFPAVPQLFLEVRHPSWFEDASLRSILAETLSKNNIGWVITDSLAHREVLHMQLTIPKTFIRFTCQGDHPTDIYRINDWAEQINDWKKNGLQKCYFFVHPATEALSPELTQYVAQQFNEICDAQLPTVNFIQGTLF